MVFDLLGDFITQVVPPTISGVISGLIIAVVITWWANQADRRKQIEGFTFLIRNIYTAVSKDDHKELYYFLKLAGEKEKSIIQQILQMELVFEAQTGSFNTKIDDKLLLKNAEYILSIDMNFQAFIFHTKPNIEEKDSYYFFLRPERQSPHFSRSSSGLSEIYHRQGAQI